MEKRWAERLEADKRDIGKLEVEAGIRFSNLMGRVTISIGRSGLIGVMITFDGVPKAVVMF